MREINNKQMTNGPTASRGNYEVVKYSIGNRPPTNDFNGNLPVLHGQPLFDSAVVRDKPLQPEYREKQVWRSAAK